MGTRFTAPEGELRSNLGLLAGTVIRELRIHHFLDDGLERVPWNFRSERNRFYETQGMGQGEGQGSV